MIADQVQKRCCSLLCSNEHHRSTILPEPLPSYTINSFQVDPAQSPVLESSADSPVQQDVATPNCVATSTLSGSRRSPSPCSPAPPHKSRRPARPGVSSIQKSRRSHRESGRTCLALWSAQQLTRNYIGCAILSLFNYIELGLSLEIYNKVNITNLAFVCFILVILY